MEERIRQLTVSDIEVARSLVASLAQHGFRRIETYHAAPPGGTTQREVAGAGANVEDAIARRYLCSGHDGIQHLVIPSVHSGSLGHGSVVSTCQGIEIPALVVV